MHLRLLLLAWNNQHRHCARLPAARPLIRLLSSVVTRAVQRTVSVQVQHIAQQSTSQQEVNLGHDATLASGVRN